MPIKLHLKPCVPPWWAKTGHLQTILGHILPSPTPRRDHERVLIPLGDGDHLVGEFYPQKSAQWIVHLFHGLGGDTDSDYMRRTAEVAFALGHSVFLVNHRDSGRGKGFARHPYHSGCGDDLSAAIAWAKNRIPTLQNIAVGFSLSGNALLTLLTEQRGEVKPDRAISVNAPIDLNSASLCLSRGWNRLYDFRFVKRLKVVLNDKVKRGHLAPIKIPLFAKVRDFDELYTAPHAGFANRQDYYDRCSTKLHLDKIQTPTVLLTAADDPFVPVESYQTAKLSPHVVMHIEPIGGHMGYLSRIKTPLGTTRWIDYALSEALAKLTTL